MGQFIEADEFIDLQHLYLQPFQFLRRCESDLERILYVLMNFYSPKIVEYSLMNILPESGEFYTNARLI